MLLLRSKNLQLFLLLVSAANCQHYSSDYDGESISEESDQPDYSKYYAADTSAPLIQPKSDADANGFVSPIEFSSFFGPSSFQFGAASNQEVAKAPKQESSGFVTPQELSSGFADFKSATPFGRDYFEESQKKEAVAEEPVDTDEYELKPGPSYISHKIVAPSAKASKLVKQKTKYGSEVNDLTKDYDREYHENKYSPYKTVKEVDEKPDYDDDKSNYEEEKKPSPSPYTNFDFNKLPLQENAAYQIPEQPVIDPAYLSQVNPHSAPSPFQKYSFQPASSSSDFSPYTSGIPNYYNHQTTPQTYEPSSSDVVAKLLKQKNCRKVNKEIKAAPGRSKRQAMDCYVCNDERSGANFEQCSYGSASTPKRYYVESTKKYNQPAKYENYRYKRYAEKEEEKEEDPYEYIKSQTQKYYSKPTDFEQHYLKAKGSENDEYRFGPEYFKEDEEKSSSEKHSEELVKKGENCNKVHKDGMICMVCKNKKGGNYEQCSYSSAPAEKKYAYVNEKNYDSDNDGAEESESTENKPVNDKQVFGQKYKGEKSRKPDEVERVKSKSTHRSKSDDFDFKELNYKKEKGKPKTGDTELYGSEKSAKYEDKPLESPDKDSYYYKHFPEYSKQESKKDEQTSEPDEFGYYGDGDKKEVEEVLAEFAKKDRSQCKKTEKKGMTCYLCTDKKGLQHEECMYVSESKPQSKYAAYHAKQESNEPKREESKITPTEVPITKNKRAPKKVEAQASEAIKATTSAPVAVAKQSKRVYRRTKNIPTSTEAAVAESRKSEENEESDEYKAEGEEGAFSEETKPIYSKSLGFSVPKYMLTKSEGEKSYDEFIKKS